MFGEVTFAVLGVLFLIYDVRTFASTFQQTFYGQANTTLALLAGGVFATSLLAPIVGWRLGPRRSVGLGAAMLGIATLLATLSRNNISDLVLTVVGLAGGFWWLALFHAARPADRPSPFPVAVPIAIVLDLALRAAFRTIPVVDQPLTVAAPLVLVAALVFLAAGLISIGAQRSWTRPGLRGAVAIAALPALLLVAETGGTNGAQIALAGGLGYGTEGRSTELALVLVGLGLAAGTLLLTRPHARGVSAAIACGAGAALLWAIVARSPIVAGLALGVGWLVFVATAFGFYAFWAYAPAVWAATAFVVVAALFAGGGGLPAWRVLPIALVPIVVVVPLVALATTPTPATTEDPVNTFRVMTYNIHQGFNAGQIPSLDSLVDVISRESPDVLVLQEVVRGWMIDEQHDALSVLSERLGLPYVFGPNIGDLYGNALLSRFPMTDVKRIHFAVQPSLKHQPRGAIGVRIGDVLVVTTHLDDIADSSSIRQEQVRAILSAWSGERTAIIAGDMNAEPGDLEMGLFGEAGYGDLGEPAGPTTTMDDPPKRIDYIWGIGVIASNVHTVRAPSASDHLALLVTVTRQVRP